MNFLVLGQHTQGLIAAALLAKAGHDVTCVGFHDDTSYDPFFDSYKTGPISHLPFAIDNSVIHALELDNHGLDIKESPQNPFQKLPFYDGLKKLLKMFEGLHGSQPPYNEKAWRDTWNTFEIGHVLSQETPETQDLFAKAATLSLNDLISHSGLGDSDIADIIALCILGSKINPGNVGTAAAILPAMAHYERESSTLIQGSLHSLSSSLRNSCMAMGVNMINDQKIRKIDCSDQAITMIILDNEDELIADHYIIDHDPIRLFETFLKDLSMPPTFKNRVYPTQNLKECAHIKMVIKGDIDLPPILAPTPDYINEARKDYETEGGAQNPILSIVNVTKHHPELGQGDAHVFDIIAQYFDPHADNHDPILIAVKQAMTNHIDGLNETDIIHISLHPISSQFGQPTFNSAMPLLQLYKVFSGYHAIAYDLPTDNAIIAGYGMGTANHYHTYDGGMRIAGIFE